jgi:DNA-binding FadR family transcriptional regulator
MEATEDWLQNDSGVELVAAYEVVARKLRRAIHLGELPPGMKLPPERTLSERLGVSRITLREALRKLEGEGYVEVGRGSRGGTVVHSGTMSSTEIRSWMRKRWNELEAILDFRVVNERSAAERAAVRATAAEVEELEKSAAGIATSADVTEFRGWDVRFHIRIAEIADSVLLRHAVEEARAELYLPFRAFPLNKMLDRGAREHAEIVKAIKSGDSRRAGKAMAKHLDGTTDELRRLVGNPDRR